jgi:hypothetical protein
VADVRPHAKEAIMFSNTINHGNIIIIAIELSRSTWLVAAR